MKKVIFTLVFVISLCPLFAHKDRIENPKDIIVSYETGEKIKISFNHNEIHQISIILSDKIVIIPETLFERISLIHFETLSLLWDGAYSSAYESSYFFLRFKIGHDKFFGEYPIATLYFDENGFSKAEINQKTNEKTWSRIIL